MDKSSRTYNWLAYASFAGAILPIVAGALHLADGLQISEAMFGGLALIVTAILGLNSVYISQVLKEIPARKRVFITYSVDKKEDAIKLGDALKRKDAYVWIDTEAQIGTDWIEATNSAIENSNTVIAVLSDNTMKPYIKRELLSAFSKDVPVILALPKDTDYNIYESFPQNMPHDKVPKTISFDFDKESDFEAAANVVLSDSSRQAKSK